MKKYFFSPILLLLLFISAQSKDVLIVYDGDKDKAESFKSACFINNLLDHFSVDTKEILHVSGYKRGMEKGKEYIFVVFEEDDPSFSRIFLEDLLLTEGNIIWIYSHIERFLEMSSKKWGISFDRNEQRRDWKIMYKGQEFAKGDPWLDIISIEDEGSVEVHSWIEDSLSNRYPYILKTQNLWYIADSPFSYAAEGGRFLILADLLHNILEEYHLPSHRALIRIEDVSPEDDPKDLKKLVDYLHKKNIPFQVSLIPIFIAPKTQYEVHLIERPEMVEALKYSVSKGGTIVLHGTTHQHRGTSAEDFEFWDDIAGKPISHESPAWVDQRIKTGISECIRNGIYPLSWETPHYSASQKDYRTIARYFDTFYDRVMAAEIKGTQQIFPYPVRLREFGVTVIPENLGYIDFGKPDPDLLLESARRMLVVRDGVASFFFHSFVPLKHIKKIVKSMKKMGWEFVSIKDFGCNLRTESLWVTSSGGEGSVKLDDHYLHEILINNKGKIINEEFSKEKHKGIVKKKLDIQKRAFYVMEALDMLPEEREKSLLASAKEEAERLIVQEKDQILQISRPLIFMTHPSSIKEEYDQKSYQSVFQVFGLDPETRELEELLALPLEEYEPVVIPQPCARRLKEAEIKTIIDFVRKGGNLITDGRSVLTERLGIWFDERSIDVSEVQELSLPAPISNWSPPVSLQPFYAEDAHVLLKDAWRDLPLVIIKPFQAGKVLFLGALFDPYTPFGISRFPYFPHYLKNSLNLAFNVRRNNLEFYFDPGLRQNTSWEKLVKRWKESGVKIIYLAAWHFYKSYEFDYRYFIDLCHSHGIAVYAWFEFPQVTPLFWHDHPGWREKTASGADAKCHWRFLMNLYNPQVRKETNKFLRNILFDYDWDGVNLAELNFDTNKGAQDPDKFTPMNGDVREAFREKAGFDPIELFNPESSYYWKRNKRAFDQFLKFRTAIIEELHIYFLEEIERIKKRKNKDFEVIVTVMDSLLHPETIEESGIDVLDIIGLMDKFPFTLQVEDPSRSWIDSPDRYLTYFKTYKKYIKDNEKLMFDINVISRRDIETTHLPSAVSTGSELATTAYYASLHSGRVALYSEFTVHPFDMDILPYVGGSDVKISKKKNGYIVDADRPFTLTLNKPNLIPFVNQKKWPFYGSAGIFLNAGRSVLSFRKAKVFDFQRLSTRMLFDADIMNLQEKRSSYRFRYNSTLPVSLTFNRPLGRINLDSETLSFSPVKLGLILPRGEHELEISQASPSFQMIDEVGYLSSWIFYIFGLLSVGSLVFIYSYSRIKK